ncbi:SpoIIE family protein phosphatase [Streptomyces sp. RFCAC02]|uniref:SpoIIE family protein phosphatase n=1 Tax=Streptomyces sp. RFCAC02 TaxID=2499143 RepID=UPI00101EF8F1|nr:SpoIIE family protein phosphatase [Streptomyces sp. RFCAC02]
MSESRRNPTSPPAPLPKDWPVHPDTSLALNRMGSFDWDLDAHRLHLDDAALDVFDLRPEEYDSHPQSLAGRVPRAEAERLDALLRQAISQGDSGYGAYFRIRRRTGVTQWTHTQGHIERDRDGRPRRIIGIVRDATAELSHAVDREAISMQRRKQTSVVEETTRAIANARTVRDVTDILTGPHGLGRMGDLRLRLGLVESGRLRMVAGGLDSPPELEHQRLEDDLPMSEVTRSRAPLFLSSRAEFATRFPRLRDGLARYNVSAAAYLPLTAQGTALGGLGLLFHGQRDFPPEERNLLVALSSGIAQSLQRAVLYEQEHDLAADLQRAMLPRTVPRVPGAGVAVRYRSARIGRDIGGDWYDVIPLPGGRVATVIGDVEGHDTHATTVMGQVRTVLRAYAAEGHPAGVVMARASAFLNGLDTDRFATCVYAELAPATGRLRLVRAGHLAPALRTATGDCTLLDVPGALPLGMDLTGTETEHPVQERVLERGETLLLYTDGLIERPGWDLDEGMELLTDSLREGPEDLQELADHMSGIHPGPEEDDMALVLLRRQ